MSELISVVFQLVKDKLRASCFTHSPHVSFDFQVWAVRCSSTVWQLWFDLHVSRFTRCKKNFDFTMEKQTPSKQADHHVGDRRSLIEHVEQVFLFCFVLKRLRQPAAVHENKVTQSTSQACVLLWHPLQTTMLKKNAHMPT